MTIEAETADEAEARIQREAAVYRRLRDHLRTRGDVQNIDLMNLAGFCRNCLSNWYREADTDAGGAMTREDARQIVYGMPYDEWRERHQTEAAPDAQAAFATSRPHD